MKVVNFSHPFSAEQIDAIRKEIGEFEIVERLVQYDMDNRDLPGQALAYLKACCEPGEPDIVIRFPAMAGELMLAVAIGYLGYLPGQIVIKSDRSAIPPKYVYSHTQSLAGVVELARREVQP